MFRTASLIVVATVAAIASLASAECQTHMPLFLATTAPMKYHTFNDDGGARNIKVTTHSYSTCSTWGDFPTGSQYIGNYTYISHDSALNTDECLMTMVNGKKTFANGFQAMIIELDGFKIIPEYNIDDIDGQADYDRTQGWQEAATTFAMSDGAMVLPTLSLPHAQTVLAVEDFVVPAAGMSALGLSFGETTLQGAGFADPATTMHNCEINPNLEETARCRIKAKYSEPVDKIVIIYGIQQKSIDDPDSGAVVSELLMDCGCRCTATNVGTRSVIAPATPSTTTCQLKDVSLPKTECDFLGNSWCTKEDAVTYKASAGTGPGTFSCVAEDAMRAIIIDDFTPQLEMLDSINI